MSGTCKNVNQISTYSIITGLILYASIYLYLLFYNDEYLSIFNKFLIYIIVVDLLLSTFYYFNLQKSYKYSDQHNYSIEEYKKQQEDLESVDMSLVDNESEISEISEEDVEETELEETELEEDVEETELKEELEEEEPEYPEHIIQDGNNLVNCDKQLDLDMEEIDALLSIPVPPEDLPSDVHEVDTPKKVKVKRQPRKKKESDVI